MEFKTKGKFCVIKFALVIFALAFICSNMMNMTRRERFDDLFVTDRYGLRGEKSRISDIRHKYIYPESNVRLNSSSGHMYESRHRPHETEGVCNKVNCPLITDNRKSSCWYCDKKK